MENSKKFYIKIEFSVNIYINLLYMLKNSFSNFLIFEKIKTFLLSNFLKPFLKSLFFIKI